MCENKQHVFPWHWNLTDLDSISKHNHTVFSVFSCGGGSSMGYKLAGFDVIGNCEIDAKIANIYSANLHPKLSYVMDARDFLNLPNEKIDERLFHLDILDGSPPCTPFSIVGLREQVWNIEKKFVEGQTKQRLDDLFFTYVAIAKKLQPKICVAENVEGLISGKAKGYVNEILKNFSEAGYNCQMFLLNSQKMGVPQSRSRIFFCAHRKDLSYEKLKLAFNEALIPFGEIRSEHGIPFVNQNGDGLFFAKRAKQNEVREKDVRRRLGYKPACFNHVFLWDNQVVPTILAGMYHGGLVRMCDYTQASFKDIISASSFPQDYKFAKITQQHIFFICGMSVPPVMMANIARQIYLQWLSKK